jgi:hypothetical protein
VEGWDVGIRKDEKKKNLNICIWEIDGEIFDVNCVE